MVDVIGFDSIVLGVIILSPPSPTATDTTVWEIVNFVVTDYGVVGLHNEYSYR